MSLLALLGDGSKATFITPGDPGGGGVPAAPAAPTEPGSFDYIVTPGENLTTYLSGKPAGSTYYLQNGSYSFLNAVPQAGDQFWGQSRTGVIIDGTSHGAQPGTPGAPGPDRTAFKGSVDDVLITRMTIRNYGVGTDGGLQEQAGIMCKAAHWSGSISDGWRIHDVTLNNNGNGGIYMGHNTVITSCEIYGHGNTGIGGAYIVGGTIQGNIIRNNANSPVEGAGDNGGGIKIVNANQRGPHIAMPTFAQVKVIDNDVYENYPSAGNGRPIWFDIDCHDVYIGYNRVTESTGGLFGIMWELCNGGIAEFNTITGAIGYAGWAGSNFQGAAMQAAESHNIVFRYNTVDGANVGYMNRLSARGTAELGNNNDNYIDTLLGRGELANSHAVITNVNQLSNIGCSTNSCIGNVFIDVDAWGDNYGSGESGNGHPTTHTYSGNDVSQSPGIVHYYNGVAAPFPGNGRT